MPHLDPVKLRGRFTDNDGPHPPIVLISADMISPDMYGDGRYADHVETPNLDRLRMDGVSFSNAFCNSPLCGPSRASYLTGRYTYLTVNEERAHDGFAVELRGDDVIFPEYLRAVGYRTRHVGKCHVGTGKFMDAFGENDNPWNRWAPPIYDEDDYRKYLGELGVDGWEFHREIQGLMPDRSTPGNSYGGWIRQPDGSQFPMEASYPHFLAWRAQQTIDLHAAADPPLYLQLDFFAPHQPFFIPGGLEDREAELREAVELPDSYIDVRDRDFRRAGGEPYVYELYTRHWGLYEEDTLRDYLVAHMLQMEVLDAAVGRVLDTLEDQGLYDEALVIFLGDHGEMNGHRALIDKGVYGHPRVQQVPLMAKLPGDRSAGAEVDMPVCLLDLAPTVLETASISPDAHLDGESLIPLIEGEKSGRDRPFLFESGWHVTANPAVSVRKEVEGRGHFLYTYNVSSPHDELYDLNDPRCTNLVGDPEHTEVLREMVNHLAGILSADPRWRCYWHSFRLEKQELIDVDAGDAQMFTPE